MAEDCGAAGLANELKTTLLAGEDLTVPTFDLTGPEFEIPTEDPTDPIFSQITRLQLSDLTEQKVGGNGVFDGLMTAMNQHLIKEFEGNRITGNEYSKTYVAMMEAAIGQGVAFMLGKDQAFWQAVAAQQQAKLIQLQVVKARVELQTAKAQLALVTYQALGVEADYALTKMKLATESINYCTAEYNLANILPQQKLMLTEQTRNAAADADMSEDQRTLMLPKQIAQVEKQVEMLGKQIIAQDFNNITMLPKQALQLDAQTNMVKEQEESQRAQTMDTRKDGVPVVGLLGKQKDLYNQQITSYKRDAEAKAAKMFVDAWITQKTLDEGLLPPTGFTNANLDQILSTLKTRNEL